MPKEFDRFTAVLSSAAEQSALKEAASRCTAIIPSLTPMERTRALEQLTGFLGDSPPRCAVYTAQVCGRLVESGADPSALERPLLTLLAPALRKMMEQAHPIPAPEEAPPTEELRPASPGLLRMFWRIATGLYRLRCAEREMARDSELRMDTPEGATEALCLAAVSLFSAAPALRRAYPEFGALAAQLRDLSEGCYWLSIVFSVLDDEPIVALDPATETGILARLSGADNNFALTMLLMQTMPGPSGTPVSRLQPAAARVLTDPAAQCTGEVVSGVWNLYTWLAWEQVHGLPAEVNTDHWIWNEGSPADIPRLDGRRAILLGPPSYVRTFPAQRTFAALLPKLEVERVLTPVEVREWLDRMTETQRDSPREHGMRP